MKANEQVNLVLEELERYHTVLSDFFPHSGLLEIGGSKVLLDTRLMPVLQDCTTRVRESLSRLDNSPPEMNSAKQQMLELWSSVIGLLGRLHQVGSERDATAVNEAATILYLANGVAWHFLRGLVSNESAHNPQYVKIEPILPLLIRCGRDTKREGDADPKQLIKRLCEELNTCLR